MDALTAAAVLSLAKETLPKLTAKVAALAAQPAAERAADGDFAALLHEAQELLGLVAAWAGGGEAAAADAPFDGAGELSDDDALAMLAAEGASDLPDVHISGQGKTVAESLSAADDDIEALDADEQAMLLAVEASEKAAQAAAAPAKAVADDAEMSDEEARALLATMDEPAAAAPAESTGEADGEMSDDEARSLLAAMDEPVAPVTADPKGEMSDDEARALLAAMDEPAAPVAADPKGEMSDAEARALLAAMDEPAAPAPKAAPKTKALSADDEALAMLASMGGIDDDDEAPAPASSVKSAPPRAAATATAATSEPEEPGEDGEVLAEIEEFAKNDFASDPDMMNDFVTNTDDLMETLDQTILQLEQNPRDKETIESIFRAAHTLKGAAGMFGFKAIERVMHRMENLFDQVRKGTLVPDSNIIDVVFQGLDVLKSLLSAVKDNKPSGTKTVPIVKALELAAKGKYVKGSMGGGKTAAPAAEGDAPAGGSGGGGGEGHDDGEKAGGSAGKKKTAEQTTIRVDLERLDALVNLVGELVIDRTRFASIDEEMRATAPQLKVAGNMQETVQLFGRHMTEIHEIIMKIRMVPIGNAFNKYTRVVRDIARQVGKDIELSIDGEDTELDKTIVEQIGDPLVHLIRNSCDHGIEMPEARAATGKRRTGTINLSARQEGNHIIITIQDDGKGLPVEAIRKKAIERGLITEEMTLAKRDIFNLIFEPGFSTAEKVTNLSGRGVGMDVVRKQISKLKGLIDMDSEPGKGTTTTIRLPLTLAIMQSLLVESAGECFAIPLSTVVESVRIKPEDIQYVGDAEVIKRHGKVLPLMHLHDTLELAQKTDCSWYAAAPNEIEARLGALRMARRKDRLYVVIVGTGDRRFGIIVDQLLNQQEMVIKSLGTILKKTPCVAGGAVLGNGEVVLVLDIQELEDRFRSKARSKAA